MATWFSHHHHLRRLVCPSASQRIVTPAGSTLSISSLVIGSNYSRGRSTGPHARSKKKIVGVSRCCEVLPEGKLLSTYLGR